MTREEAIAILEVSKHMATSGRMYNQAIDMAIEALKAEPIRCKDCRHRCKEPIYSKADVHWVIYQIGDCPIICKTVGDDDYCSFGERREE